MAMPNVKIDKKVNSAPEDDSPIKKANGAITQPTGLLVFNKSGRLFMIIIEMLLFNNISKAGPAITTDHN